MGPNLVWRIGVAVSELRRRQGLTQAELGSKVRLTQAAISMIESGQRTRRVNLNDLQRLACALGYNKLSKLIKLAEEVPEPQVAIRQAEAFLRRVRRKQ